MIKISQINMVLFVLMFLTFVFAAKLSMAFGGKIIGLEYYIWLGFAAILVILNFVVAPSRILVKRSYFVLVCVVLLFCILNFFFVDVPRLRYAQGTFFSFLFVANFILFSNLQFRREHFFLIAKIAVLTITMIGAFAYAERIFVEGEYQSYFLRGVSTLAKDSSFAAALLNINIILSLALYLVKRSRIYIYIIFFSIITIALLLFIKALVSSLIICFIFVRVYFNSRVLKLFLYSAAILFFSLLIVLGKPLYEEIAYKSSLYFGKGYENIPRNALYLASLKIAYDYFPFGSGQGTFGSLPVGKEYSQIYYDYKLHLIQGLSREDALGLTKSQFVFDTHWSSIIGEMGFIAGSLHMLLWFLPALLSLQYLRKGNPETRAMAFVIVMMTISIFIESIAAPLPGQLQFIMLYAGLGAMGFRFITRDLEPQTSIPET